MSLILRLKALADENRLKILQMLINSDLCVGALAHYLDISKPAVSQHLQVLRKAGLIKGEKRGYWTHYMVDRKVMREIADEIERLSAGGKFNPTSCWRITDTPTTDRPPKEVVMCQNCQQPIKLKDKPENCSPEQIKQCHGDVKDHPCEKEAPASKKE
jgi:ArsR family transcriptional regulator, arsenate/arsenite/antimonite-responsive transcriptional repressor